jgi:hypothetical protein
MAQLFGSAAAFMALSFAKTGKERAIPATVTVAYKHFLIVSSNANVTVGDASHEAHFWPSLGG